MTTKNMAKLESKSFRKTTQALFRPGRVDLRAQFTNPDDEQVKAFFADFFEDHDFSISSNNKDKCTEEKAPSLDQLRDQFVRIWPNETVVEDGVSRQLSLYPFRVLKNYLLKHAFRGAVSAAMEAKIKAFEVELNSHKADDKSREDEEEKSLSSAGSVDY